MNGKIRYGKKFIPYSIIKSKRRKTSEIQVDERGTVLRVPSTKTNLEIENILEGKKQWIFKKQLEFSDRAKTKPTKTQTRTSNYLDKRTWELASKIGLMPSKVVVKKLKSRWGSATKSGIIHLNETLAKTPPKVIDYVIIHELCHLKIHDHSSKFWNLLYKTMPNYEKHKEYLEKNFKQIIED